MEYLITCQYAPKGLTVHASRRIINILYYNELTSKRYNSVANGPSSVQMTTSLPCEHITDSPDDATLLIDYTVVAREAPRSDMKYLLKSLKRILSELQADYEIVNDDENTVTILVNEN